MTRDGNILSKPPTERYIELAKPVSWQAFEDIVTSRRSVRVFESEPIPDETVRRCLSMALLSANSSNLQPWDFYWVKDPLAKAKLVEACLSQPAASTAQTLIVCVARTNTWKENSKKILQAFDQVTETSGYRIPHSARTYYSKIVPWTYCQGPFGVLGFFKKMVVAVLGFFKPIPREPSSLNDMKIWATKTTALASQTLMLAFRASGYDSCPMEGIDSARIQRLLKLPNDALVVMVIGAGKRAKNGIYGPRFRFNETQAIHEV